jgi:hypothetical protein
MSGDGRLEKIRIARPCPALWEEMTGDERVRFCGLCRKNVYNLSAMSREAAERLIKERQGQICALLYRRADGTVLTSDCPVGARAFAARVARRIAASLTGLFLILGGRHLTPEFKERRCQPPPGRTDARAQASRRPLSKEDEEALRQLGYIGYSSDEKAGKHQ